MECVPCVTGFKLPILLHFSDAALGDRSAAFTTKVLVYTPGPLRFSVGSGYDYDFHGKRPWPPQLLADCGKQLRLATMISLSELVCTDEERRRATLLTGGLRIFRETFQSYPP